MVSPHLNVCSVWSRNILETLIITFYGKIEAKKDKTLYRISSINKINEVRVKNSFDPIAAVATDWIVKVTMRYYTCTCKGESLNVYIFFGKWVKVKKDSSPSLKSTESFESLIIFLLFTTDVVRQRRKPTSVQPKNVTNDITSKLICRWLSTRVSCYRLLCLRYLPRIEPTGVGRKRII